MLMLGNAKMRMMPMLNVIICSEIYLPQGNSLVQTEKVADSLEKVLKKDDGTIHYFFIGASSRFPFRLFTQYAFEKPLNLLLTPNQIKLQKKY
jgi:hypothetical protein